jgi:hypothetical protein
MSEGVKNERTRETGVDPETRKSKGDSDCGGRLSQIPPTAPAVVSGVSNPKAHNSICFERKETLGGELEGSSASWKDVKRRLINSFRSISIRFDTNHILSSFDVKSC